MIERKNINQGIVALISWLIIVVLNFFQLLYVKITIHGRFDWIDVLYYPITSLTIGIILIYIWLLPLFKKIRKLKIGIQIPLFILHGLIYTTIFIFLIFFQIALWSDNLEMKDMPEAVHRFFYTDFHNIAKNYFFLLAIFIAVEYVNKREENLMQQKSLENQLREVKIKALESKLHPHFLFNSLNGITALIKENPDKAEKVLVELSDLLRFALETDFNELISLKEEVKILEKYISIEKMRFEDQLDVMINISKEVDQYSPSVPPMIIQPIIENAIIHGFKGIRDSLAINITINPFHIIVTNTGSKVEEKIEYGNGLKIVEQRLKLHFGEQAGTELFQKGDKVICELNGFRL